MPSKIDLYQIGVWFCVGFFTGAGWRSPRGSSGVFSSRFERKR
jgi:hypothetical protein